MAKADATVSTKLVVYLIICAGIGEMRAFVLEKLILIAIVQS